MPSKNPSMLPYPAGYMYKPEDYDFNYENDVLKHKFSHPGPTEFPETYLNGEVKGVKNYGRDVSGIIQAISWDTYDPKKQKIYSDAEGNHYIIDNTADIDRSGLIREDTKKKNFIGGSGDRVKALTSVPGLTDLIWQRAKAYGVDPNVVFETMAREGYADDLIREYNSLPKFIQEGGYWNSVWNKGTSGFGSLGLDFAGERLRSGKYELLDKGATWSTPPPDQPNEKNKMTEAADPDNLRSAVEMVAAELAYNQKLISNRNYVPKDRLGTYTRAAYNMGPYHKDLQNADYVNRKYKYPDYFSLYSMSKNNPPVFNENGTYVSERERSAEKIMSLAQKIKEAGYQYSCGGGLKKKYDAGGIIQKYGTDNVRQALMRMRGQRRFDGLSNETGTMQTMADGFGWYPGMQVNPDAVQETVPVVRKPKQDGIMITQEPQIANGFVIPQQYEIPVQNDAFVFQKQEPVIISEQPKPIVNPFDSMLYPVTIPDEFKKGIQKKAVPQVATAKPDIPNMNPEIQGVLNSIRKGVSRTSLPDILVSHPQETLSYTSDYDTSTIDLSGTPETLAMESKVLGKTDGQAIARGVKNLPQDGDDLKVIQQMLFDKGYYDTSKYKPKITAKTKTEVMDLQRTLKEAGYDLGEYGENKDGIDGKIGKKTQAAFEQYVKDHPTEVMASQYVDGKLGEQTKTAFAKYLRDKVEDNDVRQVEVSPQVTDESQEATVQSLGNGQLAMDVDYILPKDYKFTDNTGNVLIDSAYDVGNLLKYIGSVAAARINPFTEYEEQDDGIVIPTINMKHHVSNDQLARMTRLLPSGLTPESSKNKFSFAKGYGETWQSNRGKHDVSEWLAKNKDKKILSSIYTSMRYPGRGTIGSFGYKTAPEGIYISDGYEFRASPKKIWNNDAEFGTGYGGLRKMMNKKFRADNKHANYYFIPWEAYEEMMKT